MDDKLSQEIVEIAEKLEKASQGAGSRGGKIIRYTPSGKPIYEESSGIESQEEDKGPEQAKVKVAGIGGKDRKNLQHMSAKRSKQKQVVKDKVKDMTKSEENTDMKDTLKGIMSRIKEMGPEGLKKAVATMSDEQKDLLGKILVKASIKPQKLENDVDVKPRDQKDLDSHSVPKFDGGRNNENDEKLVKPENEEVKHQGDESPEGHKGQKIEDKESEKGSAPADEKPLDSKPGDGSSKMDRMESENFKRNSSMKKAMKKMMKKLIKKLAKKDDGKPEIEGAQKQFGAKDARAEFRGKEEDCKPEEKPMKKSANFDAIYKSEDKMKLICKRMADKGMSKDAFLGKAKEMGWDTDKCSKLWPASPKMTKSFQWNDWQADALSISNKRGRNYNYATSNDVIEEQEATKLKNKKTGEYLNEFTNEGFKKSTTGQPSVNDLIEKKLDVGSDKLEQTRQNLEFKKSFAPRYTASFTVEELAKSLGIDAAKAEEILNGKK